MTQLQNILTTLHGETPEALPWVADLTYWYSAHERLGDLPERWRGGEGFRSLHRELGVGLLCDYTCTGYREVNEGRVTIEKIEDNGIIVTTLTTPVGSLFCRQRFLPQSHCSAHLNYFVKRAEDLAVVRYVAEQRAYVPDFDAFQRTRERWGGLGPMAVLPPRSPLPALFVEWAGVETTCYLLADARKEVEKTMEALGAAQDRALRVLADSPADIIEFPDNLSAETYASLFDRYLLPHYRSRVRMLHGAGKFVGAHLDGTLQGLLHRMPETGMDFVESVTPAPVGDMPVGKLRQLVPEDFVLIGGIPGASFAPPWTWPQLETYLQELLRYHAGTRFIVGTADQVPPNGEIEWVGMISNLLAEWSYTRSG